MNTISLVASWKHVFKASVNSSETKVSVKEIQLARNLMQEEIEEFVEAIGSENKVEILDALGDMVWTSHNASLLMGHKSDIQTLEQAYFEFANRLNVHEKIDRTVENSRERFLRILKESKHVRLEIFASELLMACYVFAAEQGILLGAIMDSIYASNMSKLVSEDKVSDTADFYEAKNISVCFEETSFSGEKRYVVKNKITGKILKSVTFKEPKFDLDKIWKKHRDVKWF